MQRYFANKIDDKFYLNDIDTHHFLHVMRAKIHEQVELVYDENVYLCEAVSLSPLVFTEKEKINFNSELPNKITLFCPLAKGEKIDLIIQKATELGVNKIVLFSNKRSVVKMDKSDFERKKKRYEMIIKEASEQSHRNIIPSIVGVYDLKELKEFLCDINYVAYEENAKSINPEFLNLEKNKTISYLIGPEGGLENSEVEYLLSIGFNSISLGKRILRCETAAIYGLSVISYLLEKK